MSITNETNTAMSVRKALHELAKQLVEDGVATPVISQEMTRIAMELALYTAPRPELAFALITDVLRDVCLEAAQLPDETNRQSSSQPEGTEPQAIESNTIH